LRRGMLPSGLFQDRQSAATSLAMTNRQTAQNRPRLTETRIFYNWAF
jgi:hypothetical protein